MAEVLRPGSNQPLHREQLFGGDHFVGASGEKIHWMPQPREVDLLSQRDEASGSKLVALVKFFDHFEIVGAGNIDGPGIPVPENGLELREFRRAGRLERLQRFTYIDRSVLAPELREIAADSATVA